MECPVFDMCKKRLINTLNWSAKERQKIKLICSHFIGLVRNCFVSMQSPPSLCTRNYTRHVDDVHDDGDDKTTKWSSIVAADDDKRR